MVVEFDEEELFFVLWRLGQELPLGIEDVGAAPEPERSFFPYSVGEYHEGLGEPGVETGDGVPVLAVADLGSQAVGAVRGNKQQFGTVVGGAVARAGWTASSQRRTAARPKGVLKVWRALPGRKRSSSVNG